MTYQPKHDNDRAEIIGHRMQGRIEHPRYRDSRHKKINIRWLAETVDDKIPVFELPKGEEATRYTNSYSPRVQRSVMDDVVERYADELTVLLYNLTPIMPEIVKRDSHPHPILPEQERLVNILMSLHLMKYEPARELMETARDDYIRMYEETRLNLR